MICMHYMYHGFGTCYVAVVALTIFNIYLTSFTCAWFIHYEFMIEFYNFEANICTSYQEDLSGLEI